VELSAAGLFISIFYGYIRAVKSNLLHSISFLRNGKSTKTTPKLYVQLKLDLFLLIWVPGVHRVECFLNQFFLTVGNQLKVTKHFTGQDISLSRTSLLFNNFLLAFAAFGSFFLSRLLAYL
jgi:hypothetical protein